MIKKTSSENIAILNDLHSTIWVKNRMLALQTASRGGADPFSDHIVWNTLHIKILEPQIKLFLNLFYFYHSDFQTEGR